MTFRPMLAAKMPNAEHILKLKYPLLVSAKLNGIRMIMVDGEARTRSMKLIPNTAIQNWFCEHADKYLNGLDGELIVGAHDERVLNRTTSAVMSHMGNPMENTVWHVFDILEPGTFAERYIMLKRLETELPPHIQKHVRVHTQLMANTPEVVMPMHQAAIANGYEGLILRNPKASYKQGRSTLGEEGMIKVKVFEDAEARVISIEKLNHNANPAALNEVGYTKRLGGKAGHIETELMGALVCQDLKTGVIFNIGTGFTHADRVALGVRPPIGSIVKYKFFPQGILNKPLLPVFLAFRDKRDM